MNALILYFSGTGNTKYAAQKFEQELKNRNIRTEIHSIEEDFSIKPDTYDLLIFGCPKYYECPVFAMKYSASEDCIGCGLCAGKCPKNNITMKDKKPELGRNCMFCMRCINLCPANAILYRGTKFPQYNIKQALY